MTVSRRAVLGAFGALGTSAALAACSTGSTSSTSSPSATGSSTGTADADAFPVSIKNSLGTATIPKAPTRIATFGIGNEDYLAVLGVVPALVPSWGEDGNSRGSTDWYDEAVKKLGKDYPAQYKQAESLPIDEIAKATPDLLFGPYSGLTEQEYAKASKLAPTVAAPGSPYGATWQDTLKIAGQAVGKKDAAAQAQADLEKQIADAVAKYPAIKGKTIAVLRFFPADTGKIYSLTSRDPRQALMLEFGFTTPQFVTDLTKANPNAYGAPISAEKAASTIDAQVALVLGQTESDFDGLKKSPLLSAIPAIKNGSVVYSTTSQDTNALNCPTVLSIPVVLKTSLPKLGAAAEKAK